MHLDGINLKMSEKPTQQGRRYKILQRCYLWSGCLSQGQITSGCCVQRGFHKGWTGLAHRRRRRSSKTVNLFPLKRCKQRGRTSPTHSFSLLFFWPNLLLNSDLFVFLLPLKRTRGKKTGPTSERDGTCTFFSSSKLFWYRCHPKIWTGTRLVRLF